MPVISTNTAANSAVRYLNMNSADQSSSLSKLASGSRISQASDDAAGLAISTKISSDVTTLTQAATNASHGVSVLQTADGGASNISDILQRMKALASQSASGTVTDTERAYVNAEFSQLTDEIDGIASSTRYNGQSLLDGSSAFADKGVTVMVGSDSSDTITVAIDALTSKALGLTAAADETASNLVGGSAGITIASSTAATATAAVLTGTSALAAVDASGGAKTFNIGSETVTLSTTGGTSADGNYSAADLVSAINAQTTGLTASLDTGGKLVLTSDTTGSSSSLTVGTFTGGMAAADLGLTTTTATGAAAGASVAGSASFTVNGTAVTLTSSGGTSGTYSATQIATAINTALSSVTGNTVTASVDATSGKLTLSNSDKGSDAEITLAFADANLSATDLGFTDLTNTGRDKGDVLDVSTQAGASDALERLDSAINLVSQARADIGATESRFNFRSESISTSIENLTAAESAISDVDVASESAKLASAKVKTQAAVAAATQASQMPQDLLKLLQ